jgi:hypothetical protein
MQDRPSKHVHMQDTKSRIQIETAHKVVMWTSSLFLCLTYILAVTPLPVSHYSHPSTVR